MTEDPHQKLRDIKPTKSFFIGIDSDGCAFDTMEIKHKECFCPNFIRYWELQNISKYARETWEFVNLYSHTRGCNRFHAVIETMRLLAERKEVKARNAKIPDLTPLIEWVKKETKLGNPALEAGRERSQQSNYRSGSRVDESNQQVHQRNGLRDTTVSMGP